MFQRMMCNTSRLQALKESVYEYVSTKWFEYIFYVVAKMEQELLYQWIEAITTVCKYH